MVIGLAFGFLGMFLLGVSGAITALGDTLFPAGSLAEGIAQDFLPTAHFLVRLRIYHPIVAIVTGLFLAFMGLVIYGLSDKPLTRRLAIGMVVLFGVQLAAGMINLVLLAPIAMQMVHLLLADLVWINLVLLSANVLADDLPPEESQSA
jgi:heme A synthase